MRLDPSNPFDVYFALRLAFVDRPEVRLRLQERMASPDPRGRFAPDPALWSVDAYANVDPRDLGYHESVWALVNERKLIQTGDLARTIQEAGVGRQALDARTLWDHGAGQGWQGEFPEPAGSDEPWDDPRRRFSAEVLDAV